MSNTIAAKVKNTPGNAGDAIVNSLLALKVKNNGCLECSMIRRGLGHGESMERLIEESERGNMTILHIMAQHSDSELCLGLD